MKTTEYLDRKFASGKLHRCWMCGCSLTRHTASVDHLQPRSRGGRNVAANFRLACKPCNARRGNSPMPDDARLAVKGIHRAGPRRDHAQLAVAIQALRARSAR